MKAILIIVCYLIIATTFAQNKIEGIGKFKIGKTTIAIIDELTKESGYPRKAIYDISELSVDSFQVAELVINKESPLDFHLHSSHCPQASVFLINRYAIAGVELTNIILTFKNGTLISFFCDNTLALDEALSLKYGEVETIGKKEQSSCTGLSNNIYSKKWINGSILASEYTKYYYDTNCRKYTIDYFWIRNTASMEELSSCSTVVEKKLKNTQNSELKKKLSDF